MTCHQLFVLRCDFTWPDGSFIRRCVHEILGEDRESASELRRRALTQGWTIDDMTPSSVKHLCVVHRPVWE